jgi:hypothetical protein
MRIDDYISAEEMRLINELKGKSRMEQDQIIAEYERKVDNG